MLHKIKILSMRRNKPIKNFKCPNSMLRVESKILSLVQRDMGTTIPQTLIHSIFYGFLC